MTSLDRYQELVDIVLCHEDISKIKKYRHVTKKVYELFGVLPPNDLSKSMILNKIQQNINETSELISFTQLETNCKSAIDKLIKDLRKEDKMYLKNGSDRKITKTKQKRRTADNTSNHLASKSVTLSKELASLLGVPSLPQLAINKELWRYIKEHNLQDPNDKQIIVCDQKMAHVFGESIHMLALTKATQKHIILDTTSNET